MPLPLRCPGSRRTRLFEIADAWITDDKHLYGSMTKRLYVKYGEYDKCLYVKYVI